jgi:hypothetical protein
MRINGANGQEGGQEGGAADGTADPLEQFLQDKDGQSFFDAPQLFDPQDKTVKYSPAPVHRAVYQRPAGTSPDRVTTRPITFEKSQRDAVGWTSAAQ